MSQIDAIGRFLGLPPGDRSPLSLLNITREQCDAASIDAALVRRLERVDRHIEASTPEADTVRMALYAAAAQLADPTVRSKILGQTGADAATGNLAVTPPLPDPTQSSAERQAQIRALMTFRRTAIRTILLCRGWNRKSRRMLAAIADASGIDPEHMAVALRSLTSPMNLGALETPPRPAPAPTPPRNKPTFYETLREEPAGSMGVPSNVILGVGGAIAAVAIILIVAVRILAPDPVGSGAASSDAPAAITKPADSTPAVSNNKPDIRNADRQSATPGFNRDPDAVALDRTLQQPPDPAGLVRTLRRCVELAKTDPGEAAWRFEQAVSQLSGAWTSLDPATIEAAQDAILVFMIEAPAGGERSRRALNAIAAGAKRQAGADRLAAFEVPPAVWSCGALVELIAAPGTHEPVRRYALSALDSAVGSFDASGSVGFTEGAIASLESMTRPLSMFDAASDSIAAWNRWREALDAVTRSMDDGGVEQRELITLDAIETIMRLAPPLAQRPDVYSMVTAMLGSLRWSPESASGAATPARLALLRWFDDQSIETEDLALITEWLVRESETPGIGIQMTLRRDAGLERRAAQRDRYASVWSLGDGLGADELAVAWRRAASEAIAAQRMPSSDVIGSLLRAARHARLNEAAARRWRREISAARLIMADPFAVVETAARPRAPSGSLDRAGGRRDGAWATEYLGANKSAEQKFAAISRLELWGGDIGPIDGDVLARAALLGSPPEVRAAAQRTVRKRADEPPIINGLLEAIAVAPRNESTRALIETVTRRPLPSPRSGAWPRAARLALTERLLEMLAGRSGLSAIDRIADTLRSSYHARAEDESTPGARNAPTPARAARSLWSSWRTEAGRIVVSPRAGRSLEMIDRRRRGRVALASGPVQVFAAEQSSIAEVMGYVVSSERPSRARDIDAVLDRLADERRRAGSIFEQIEATERATLTLWMIRFGEALPESIFPTATPTTEEAPS